MNIVKVLHVVGHLGKGGDSTAIFNVMKYIENYHVNIQFDFLTHNGCDENVINDLKKSHSVFVLKNDARKMNPIVYYKEVKKILKKNHYDCIHFHTSFQSCIGLLAAKRCNVPVRICHSHTSDIQRKCNPIIKAFALPVCKWLIEKLSTRRVSCSREAANNLFLSNSKVDIIYNGIDIENLKNIDENEVERIKECINYQKKDIIVGQVGRFSDMKNQDFTIDIAKENNSIKFVLLGDGENFGRIKERVENEKLKNVFLMGRKSNISDYMSLFDFLLLPSKYGEGLPVVLIEQQVVNPNCTCIVEKNVSKESNLGSVVFLDLAYKEEWIKKIQEKKNSAKCLDCSTFDINNTAKKWIDIYN